MTTVADIVPKPRQGRTVADLVTLKQNRTVADLLKEATPDSTREIQFEGTTLTIPAHPKTGAESDAGAKERYGHLIDETVRRPIDTSWGGYVWEHRASVPRGKKRPETDNPWPDDPRFKLLYDRANMGMQIDEKYLQGLSNEQTAFLLSRSSRPLTKYKEPKNYGVERWVPLVASESQAKAWETEGEQNRGAR